MDVKGKVVDRVPSRSSDPRVSKAIVASAETAQLTGKPVLAATKVPVSRINTMRQYTSPPFVTDKGRIKVEMRYSKVIDGKRVGDVYFTWMPNETESETKETK